ncbi:MAG TPA: hypothetical protein PLT45_04970 [Smithella sp.]|nr:hypothetical protein [Smithella sp.]
MSLYLQIILLVVIFAAIVFIFLYIGGLALRRACFQIVAEMEQAGAFKESRAIDIQDERKNFFRVGTKNIRPRALNLLMADGIVIKTNNGKYFLDRAKLDEARAQLAKK